MLRLAGVSIALLGLVALACSSDNEDVRSPTTTVNQVSSDTFPETPTDFIDILLKANASAYTLGCLYEDDFTRGGYDAAEILAGLPLNPSESWAIGTVGSMTIENATAFMITLYDPVGDKPIGADAFDRIEADGRVCFIPS